MPTEGEACLHHCLRRRRRKSTPARIQMAGHRQWHGIVFSRSTRASRHRAAAGRSRRRRSQQL